MDTTTSPTLYMIILETITSIQLTMSDQKLYKKAYVMAYQLL